MPTDFWFRGLSTFLQIVGVATVWWDLTDTARRFGHPGIVKSTLAWIRSLFQDPPPITCEINGILSMKGLALGRVKSGLPPDPTLEQRLVALERNLESLENEVSTAFVEQDRLKNEMEVRIVEETSSIRASVDALKRDVEALAVGGHALLAFGAFWLAIGVAIAGFVPELTKNLGS